MAALALVAAQMEEEDGQPLDTPWGEFKKLPVDNNRVQWVRPPGTQTQDASPGVFV